MQGRATSAIAAILAPGGAQEYFGVRADMVSYGKTLGGGLPIGVLCGKREWMRRFRDEAPADICFARGTFNSHPYVMGAMNAGMQTAWVNTQAHDWPHDVAQPLTVRHLAELCDHLLA